MVIKPPTATYLLKNAAGIQRGARLLGIYSVYKIPRFNLNVNIYSIYIVYKIPRFNLNVNMKYIEKIESFQILLTNN